MTVLVGGCTIVNWAMAGVQHLLFRKSIRDTELTAPPIFILGHWRSGTTLLHEILATDQQLAYPSNFDTFVPPHALITRWWLYPLLKILMPGRRPMDNMALSADSPQEDDMSLCSLGAPTPYRRMAFPNTPNTLHHQLNPDNLTEEDKEELESSLRYFYQILTRQYNRRLVLKSPPHTGRIELLAKWFPGAKFIHISRNPIKMVPSTMHLWRSLDQVQGYQIPNYSEEWLRQYVSECRDQMYTSYFEASKMLPSNQLVEMSFEDLLEEPATQMERVYSQLEIPGYDQAQKNIEAYFDRKQNHKKNSLELTDEMREYIESDWQSYSVRFGYDTLPVKTAG